MRIMWMNGVMISSITYSKGEMDLPKFNAKAQKGIFGEYTMLLSYPHDSTRISTNKVDQENQW